MYRRINPEEIVHVETKVWQCTSETCKGWVRDNFTFSDEPSCPLCNSKMQAATKMLQAINNPGMK
ncbi:cold-shock protein [Bacillus sp. V5-8f]|uniref:cold-shock protein n=1 Tax=Bacillus sp. V5-8f TaxID=2053044 RepID=UPI000C76B23F|nr:cold-shock protein [Bacillus sp. V5-8f]PLT35043.1 cold-shock protein [Bacillus sp. V5-8f]